jgi:hypothetical protein
MRYPLLFSKKDTEDGKMYYPIALGIDCNDGWFHIINNLCFSIYSYCKNYDKPCPDVVQVKEKFGTLRFYVNNGDDTIHQLINFAEGMSVSTCEICGNIGRTVGGGWVSTLCDKHIIDRSDIKEPVFNYNVGDIISIVTDIGTLRAKIVSTSPVIKAQLLKVLKDKDTKEKIVPVEYKTNSMFSYFILKK